MPRQSPKAYSEQKKQIGIGLTPTGLEKLDQIAKEFKLSRSELIEQIARGDPVNSPRRTIAGGILSQLMDEANNQLAYHEAEAERLKARLIQLQELLEVLFIKTGESRDNDSNTKR